MVAAALVLNWDAAFWLMLYWRAPALHANCRTLPVQSAHVDCLNMIQFLSAHSAVQITCRNGFASRRSCPQIEDSCRDKRCEIKAAAERRAGRSSMARPSTSLSLGGPSTLRMCHTCPGPCRQAGLQRLGASLQWGVQQPEDVLPCHLTLILLQPLWNLYCVHVLGSLLHI